MEKSQKLAGKVALVTGGTPGMLTALHEFLAFASKQPGVRFMRKDAIAQYASASAATRHETHYF